MDEGVEIIKKHVEGMDERGGKSEWVRGNVR